MIKKILPFFLSLCLFSATTLSAHAALTTNLQAYYTVDQSSGDATDATGNGFTMSNINTATFEAGLINNATKLVAASSQYFRDLSDQGLTVGGNVSISLWFKPASNPTSGNTYTLYTTGLTPYAAPYVRYWIGYANVGGTLTMRFNRERTCISNNFTDDVVTLTTGTWYHIVETYDGTNVTGYINGSQVAQQAESGDGNNGCPDTNYALIGAFWSAGATNFTNGDIDEVGIWSRAISSTEVSQLYNSGTGCQYPFTAVGSPKCFGTSQPQSILSFIRAFWY